MTPSNTLEHDVLQAERLQITHQLKDDTIERLLSQPEELEQVSEKERESVLNEITGYCVKYPEKITELIRKEQFQIIKELVISNSLRPLIVKNLVGQEYFEEAIHYNESPQFSEIVMDLREIYSAFATKDPVQAFLYGQANGNTILKATALDSLVNTDDSTIFLEAYKNLPSQRSREELVDALYARGKIIYSLTHYPEIQMHALEVKDTYTLEKIAHELLENACDEEGYEEALAIAYEADEWEIIEEFIDAAEDDEVQQYAGLLDIANSIIGQVAHDFEIKLPQKVRTGGQTGSYATIRYGSFGGGKNVYENDSVSEIRATP